MAHRHHAVSKSEFPDTTYIEKNINTVRRTNYFQRGELIPGTINSELSAINSKSSIN